jgi:hypothetical protein
MTDPYANGKLRTPPYACKEVVRGTVCAVLMQRLDNRGLELVVPPSRAVRAGDVHELLLSDEQFLHRGQRIDRITGLVFFVVTQPGVILRGDRLTIDAAPIGSVLGFDESHAPNHLNIVLSAEQRRYGRGTGLTLGGKLEFCLPAPDRHSSDLSSIAAKSSR